MYECLGSDFIQILGATALWAMGGRATLSTLNIPLCLFGQLWQTLVDGVARATRHTSHCTGQRQSVCLRPIPPEDFKTRRRFNHSAGIPICTRYYHACYMKMVSIVFQGDFDIPSTSPLRLISSHAVADHYVSYRCSPQSSLRATRQLIVAGSYHARMWASYTGCVRSPHAEAPSSMMLPIARGA